MQKINLSYAKHIGIKRDVVMFIFTNQNFQKSGYIPSLGFYDCIDNLLNHILTAIFSCPIPTALCSRDFLYSQKLFSKNSHFSLAVFISPLLRVYEQRKETMEEYIEWHNGEKIKVKLNGLSPVEYRKQTA